MIALLGYSSSLSLLSIFAAIFLYTARVGSLREKTHIYYFVVAFIAFFFAFLSITLRFLYFHLLSITFTVLFLVLAISALKYAFLWRKGHQRHLYQDPIIMTNLVAITFICSVLLYDSLMWRIILVIVDSIALLLWARRDIIIDPNKISFGERQARFGILASVLILIMILFGLSLITPYVQDPWYHAAYTLACQSVVLILLLGSTLSLVLSDIIDTHYKNSITDMLTGLYNRRYFMTASLTALKQSQRYRFPMSILLCDIDFFKKINDTYGHDIGDEALQSFAELLNKTVRDIDTVARFGGEEFVILLPQTPIENAEKLAERIRAKTEKIDITTKQGHFGFSVSIGVTSCKGEQEVENLIVLADEALYKAKDSGRNRVCTMDS
ncbi:MAG: hypothetical protein COA99_09040 [Moraxellaceae bacterium]|nr:MAG: hypothetical protein COA99_09040 [Moraxellaceae bacterium]